LEEVVSSRLREAKREVIGCVYSIRKGRIMETLFRLQEKGVKVKLLMDKGEMFTPESAYPLLRIRHMVERSPSPWRGVMHHKFWVIDKRWVISGSFNPGSSPFQHNNVLIINSEPLARNFLQEFECIKRNEKNYSYFPVIEEKEGIIENYFFPSKKGLKRILHIISTAQEEILFAYYSFTHPQVREEILKSLKRGVRVKGIVDYYQSRISLSFHVLNLLGFPVMKDKNYGSLFHHKFMVIDRRVVITGSLNLTKNGVLRNREDILILSHPRIVKRFVEVFNKYYGKWKE